MAAPGETRTTVQIRWSLTDTVESPTSEANRDLLIDVSLSEDHERTAQLTDSPVEVGVDMSDHRRVGPALLTMQSLVAGTTQAIDVDQFRGFDFRRPEDVEDAIRAAMLDRPVVRPKDAYAELEQLFAQAKLLTITTELRVYERMAITSLRVHRDSNTGDALVFNATFREVVLASSQIVTITATQTSVKSAETQKPLGPKATAPAPAEVDESVARSFVGGATVESSLNLLRGLTLGF